MLMLFNCSMASANLLIKLLDTNKLKGSENYFEWTMNIRLVLEYEKLGYVTKNSLPVDIDPESTPEERRTFEIWKDDNLKVKSYILGSMVPDFLRQYIDVSDAYTIMNKFKELFEANQEIEIYRRSKQLFQASLKDGEVVSPHVLNMIENIHYLEGQGIAIDDRLG